GLHRSGNGHLWSVDLPAIDTALHHEIGMAVPEDMRSRWTYVAGARKGGAPRLGRGAQRGDLFLPASPHPPRHERVELDTVWPALPPGAVAVVDDIDRNLGFARFIERVALDAWVARHVIGDGLWGTAIKAR